MKKSIAYLIATWFKSGLSPKAPGTVGSVCSLPLAWFLTTYGGTWGIIMGTVIVFFIGWWATHIVLQDKSNGTDPGFVVIDETAGQVLSFVFVAHLPINVYFYILGFAFFRFFDILKPWPVSYFDQKVHSAFGVMTDDICAGLYAGILLAITNWLIF